MFKNVPHVKKKRGKNASETYFYWTNFLGRRKPVLVTKSLFYLFWHWFITLAHKLKEATL